LRAVLLSNPEVASFINKEFVPVWESIRPVPKVTIDFGDGRVLKRTLQGNTVMYICLPDGRVIDALPGVYTAQDFLSEVKTTLSFLNRHKENLETASVVNWHKNRVSSAIKSEKFRITYSKAFVESPLLKALGFSRGIGSAPTAEEPLKPGSFEPVPDEASSTLEADLKRTGKDLKSAFEAISGKLEDISKQPATVEQLRRSYGDSPKERRLSPEELGKMAVQIDSRNNLSIVRPAVHLLFAGYQELPTPAECSDVIYKQILHVPIDDPYFGLADALVPGTPPGK
jgi:hypothetical protein